MLRCQQRAADVTPLRCGNKRANVKRATMKRMGRRVAKENGQRFLVATSSMMPRSTMRSSWRVGASSNQVASERMVVVGL